MFAEMKIRHLIGVTALSLLAMSILLLFIFTFTDMHEEFLMVALNFVLYVVTPVIFFKYHFKKQGVSVRQVVYTKGVKRWTSSIFGIVVVSIAFSLATFWLYLYALNPFFPSIVNLFLEDVPLPDNAFYFAFDIITITILAPIVEEFVFRGVILHRLIRKTSVWGGILLSSLLFGILHADIIGAFLFGVIASLLFIKTGNLLIPILMHALNNTIAVVFMFVAPTWPDSIAILERSDIVEKAFPNATLLVISSILTGYIVYRLGKGMQNKIESIS